MTAGSWELEHQLDPRDAADGALDADMDAYTNVEEFQHRATSL